MTAQLTDSHIDLDLLAQALTGSVHRPGDARYDELSTPWNVSVPSRPIAVVEAACAEDVAVAVRHAAGRGLRVTVQATGHGAAVQEGPYLLISTVSLDELTVSPTGNVRAGAGVRWQRVIDAGAALGYAALCGSSPGVGVVGFLTGGGIGPLARSYGVSSDYVTAFDVVTGDGRLRRATATENVDLFWGLRGGKGALGIITAVEFDLVPLAELLGGCLFFDAADAAAVFHTWSTWTRSLPEEATSSIAVLRLPPMPGVPEPLAGKVTVAVRFAWVGDVEHGRAVLAGIADAGRVVFGGVGVMPYAAVGMIHSDPVDPMPSADASTVLQALPAAAVDTILAQAGPAADCPQVIVEVRHLGGAITRAHGGDSALDHRDAAYVLTTIGIAVPPVGAATRAHSTALLAALSPWSDGGLLPNFEASPDPAVAARKYRPATLARLAALADSYDPHQIIAAADPIRAAVAG